MPDQADYVNVCGETVCAWVYVCVCVEGLLGGWSETYWLEDCE